MTSGRAVDGESRRESGRSVRVREGGSGYPLPDFFIAPAAAFSAAARFAWMRDTSLRSASASSPAMCERSCPYHLKQSATSDQEVRPSS